jgi:hypothetical protein
MSSNCEIVVFQLRREADGLYTATSPSLAGVCVVHRDKEKILEDMPNIVRLWYKRNRNQDVAVFTGPEREDDDILSILASTIPAEIAAQHLGR